MAEAAAPDVGHGLEAGVGQGPLRPGEVAVGHQGRLPRTPEVATADTLRLHPHPVHPRRHQGLLVKMKVKEQMMKHFSYSSLLALFIELKSIVSVFQF